MGRFNCSNNSSLVNLNRPTVRYCLMRRNKFLEYADWSSLNCRNWNLVHWCKSLNNFWNSGLTRTFSICLLRWISNSSQQANCLIVSPSSVQALIESSFSLVLSKSFTKFEVLRLYLLSFCNSLKVKVSSLVPLLYDCCTKLIKRFNSFAFKRPKGMLLRRLPYLTISLLITFTSLLF